MTPHKNQALLIKSFYYFQRFLKPKSRLVLVGGQDPIYTNYLRGLATSLGIEKRVKITGKVSQKTLEAYYQSADAFVCTSLHEGFCIPLVEAMRRDLPVFSFANTGMKETLGGAGIELNTDLPHEIAEILATALGNPSWLKVLLHTQRRRLEEIATLQNAERVQALCASLIHRLRRQPKQPRHVTEGVLPFTDKDY